MSIAQREDRSGNPDACHMYAKSLPKEDYVRAPRRPLSRAQDDDPFYRLTEEETRRHAGKWIVAYRGEIRGVGRTLNAALRRAGLPRDAEPYLQHVPVPEVWLL